MKIEATNEMPGGLGAEIARLRAQANAWEQVWAAIIENAPYGWRDFSKVGVESAVNAIRSMAVTHGLQGYRGYVDAFYELAGMMDVCAQPRSPKEVWETQMRPALQKLIDSEARMEQLVPVAHAHMDPATGMHWLQWMGDPAKIPMPLYDRPPLGKPIAFIEKWADWEDDELVWDVEEGSGRMYMPLYAGTPFREGES